MKRIFLMAAFCSQILMAQSVNVDEIIQNFNTKPQIEWALPISNKESLNIKWSERISSFTKTEGIRTFAGYVDNKMIGVISIHKNIVSGEIYWKGKTYLINTQKGKIILKEEKHKNSCDTIHNEEYSILSRTNNHQNRKFAKGTSSTTTQSHIPSDGVLRIYRLAILIDKPIFSKDFNQDISKVKAYWASTEIFLNEVFMRDVGIKFQVVDDENLILKDTPIYDTGSTLSYVMYLSTTTINKLLGNGNDDEGKKKYDIGVSIVGKRGRTIDGIALLSQAHNSENKGAIALAYTVNKTMAHEIGHMFGAGHTFTTSANDGWQTEPLNGNSIMGYGNYGTDFFSLYSIHTMREGLANNPWYYSNIDRTIIAGEGTPLNNSNIPYGIDTQNKTPIIDRNQIKSKYQLPPETAFQFDVKASDPENNPLIYWAHQTDPIYRGSSNPSTKTKFNSYKPSNDSIIRFDAKYDYDFRIRGKKLKSYTKFEPGITGEFNFWVGAGDSSVQPNSNYINQQNHASRLDVIPVKVEVVAGAKPFIITSQKGTNNGNHISGEKYTLTWQVDKSIFGENSRVRILMSNDFGKSWKYIINPNTENDGYEEIIIPNITLTGRILHYSTLQGNITSAKGLFRIEVIDHIATAMTDGGIDIFNGGFEIHQNSILFTNLPEKNYIKVKRNQIPNPHTVTATSSCSNKNVTITMKEEEKNNILNRIWEATDTCGNKAYFSQFIEIEENTDNSSLEWVESSFPEDIKVSCENIPNAISPQVVNAEGAINITHNDNRQNGNCSNTYTIKRTYTATDGKTSISRVQTIEVEDKTPPTFVEPLPQNTEITEGENIPSQMDLTATDNCSTNVSVEKSENRETNKITYTWTATDECGNKTTHQQIITITPKPIQPITFIGNLPIKNIKVSCENIPSAETLTAIGGTSIPIITSSDEYQAGSCENSYTIIRTWTAKDDKNNTAIHTQTIEVEDKTPPTFIGTLPQDIEINDEKNIPTQITLTTKDNCGTTRVLSSKEELMQGDDKIIIYKWIANDNCGNSNEHSQRITIKQSIPAKGIVKQKIPTKGAIKQLYPNPIDDIFHLKGFENIQNIKIYNSAGRLIKQFTAQDFYDISELSCGIYVIVIQSENSSDTFKIIKK